jgi:diguanylate cyclase (GGDEF)-like protein/PAS domain S-box-containing protein
MKPAESIINTFVTQGFFDAIGDAISIQDIDFRILYQNSRHKDIIGDRLGEYCYTAVHGKDHVCPRCHLALTFKDGKVHTYEQSRTEGDETRYYEITGSPLKDKTGTIVAGIEVVRDITRRKKTEMKLRDSAITDELTGLFNRRGFFAFAEKQCKLASRNNKRMFLLYLDLDGMKNINDELGHKEGDMALMDTADILRETFRDSDIIARLGGDEFAVLLTDIQKTEVGEIIIEHLEDNLSAFNRQKRREYEILLSMGLSRFEPEAPCSITDLLKKADILMYEDKVNRKHDRKDILEHDKQTSEKRISSRYRPHNDCAARLNNVPGEVMITDISHGGTRLVTSEPLHRKSFYTLKSISCEQVKTSAKGVVVWSSSRKMRNRGKKSSPLYEAGLKFIGLNEHEKKSLKSIMDKLAQCANGVKSLFMTNTSR